MQEIKEFFLEALRASLTGRTVRWNEEASSQETIAELLKMAEQQHVLPMIYETLIKSEVLQRDSSPYNTVMKHRVIQSVATQAMRTEALDRLITVLYHEGVAACVVKGIICRNLYPNPDMRMSGDEDLFVPAEQFSSAYEVLLNAGMVPTEQVQEIEKAFEISLQKADHPVHIELHQRLFAPESQAYGDFNIFFDGIHSQKSPVHTGKCGLIEEVIHGTRYLTLNHTDHLLYLILHAFKHFLHSGVGIRQVCDICLFANQYGSDVDWGYVLSCLREVRADKFAAALFGIGEKYLTFDSVKAGYPQSWKEINVDENALLQDILNAGVFGQSDMSRKHSSNITLNAVIADRQGKKTNQGKLSNAIQAVCLPADRLENRYRYLKKMPFLLPVAWMERVLHYSRETVMQVKGNTAAESLQLGEERIVLLQQYGVIHKS